MSTSGHLWSNLLTTAQFCSKVMMKHLSSPAALDVSPALLTWAGEQVTPGTKARTSEVPGGTSAASPNDFLLVLGARKPRSFQEAKCPIEVIESRLVRPVYCLHSHAYFEVLLAIGQAGG